MTSFEGQRDETNIGAVLREMRSILVHAAGGGTLAREHAVEYLTLRTKLLESELGKVLPGFVYQCVTVLKFRDFISLYDPETTLRVAFIDRMIERCGAMVELPGQAPSHPVDAKVNRL